MSDIENFVASLVAELGTPTHEDAFHRLIELGPGVIPILTSAFRDEPRSKVRTRLIEAISEFRDPVTIEFLEVALGDSEASVWKASLDGLVSLGGRAVVSALRRVRQGEPACAPDKSSARLEYIDEALNQVLRNLG